MAALKLGAIPIPCIEMLTAKDLDYRVRNSGARNEDGYIRYRGRLDDIINSAGYRIGPTEVENALLDHPDVAECAVVGKPDAARGEIVKAFVVLRAGRRGTDELAKALQEHCRTLTAPYKYPREVAFVESLPKTSTGKIKRRELREETTGTRPDAAADRKPNDAVSPPGRLRGRGTLAIQGVEQSRKWCCERGLKTRFRNTQR